MARVLRIKTDLVSPSLEKFPAFDDFEFPPFDDSIAIMADIQVTPPRNKMVEQITKGPGRKPSPQPTHFSVPLLKNGNGQRVIRSATIGYVAPEFKGKIAQMAQGKPALC